jgi:hypothetical protein
MFERWQSYWRLICGNAARSVGVQAAKRRRRAQQRSIDPNVWILVPVYSFECIEDVVNHKTASMEILLEA